MKRILVADVYNNAGVLNRFTGVLNRRQVNIEGISAGKIDDHAEIFQITTVVAAESLEEVEQIINQLTKQVDVIKVVDITETNLLARELVLTEIAAPFAIRRELLEAIAPFSGKIIDTNMESVVILVTETSEKVNEFLTLARPYGIKKLARTGVTGFSRG